MALRKRGAKPQDEEEEDLEEGAEEEAEEEGAEEEAGEEEAGEEEAAEEEGGEEEEEEGEEEAEGEGEADEEAVSTRSRRGPAARGTIDDKPVMDGYTWMTVVTCALFIIAIIVQIREHSTFWRMGMAMSSEPVRSTTHFNTVSENEAQATKVNRVGEHVDPTVDTFGMDKMEYQEVTDQDVKDYKALYERVIGNGRGGRPLPVLQDKAPEPDSGRIKRMVPLTGLAALKWELENKAEQTGESAAPLGGGTPPTGGGAPDAGAGSPTGTAVPPPVPGVPTPTDPTGAAGGGAVPPPPPPAVN